MSKLENNIGWCDVTMNPGIGCRGCELGDQCYAKFDTPARVLRAGKWPTRLGQPTETFGKDRVFVPTKEGLKKLRALNKLCICDQCHKTVEIMPVPGTDGSGQNIHCGGHCGGRNFRRIRAFCDSNSDWMDWPIDVLAEALDEIHMAPNVDVILLTKWPELFEARISKVLEIRARRAGTLEPDWVMNWKNGIPPQNVWVLTSVLGNVFDQKRIENVLKIPAAVRGLSCEPLWDYPIYGEHLTAGNFQWIIAGCDSSADKKGWHNYSYNVQRIINVSRIKKIAAYHKQMPINGKVSLDINQFPEWARVRQFPKINS